MIIKSPLFIKSEFFDMLKIILSFKGESHGTTVTN